MNESDLRSDVHYLGSSENKAWKKMVSFNVELLFTNIPIDAAVQAALQKLENDPSLADRTMLTHSLTFWPSMAPPQGVRLLLLFLTSTWRVSKNRR